MASDVTKRRKQPAANVLGAMSALPWAILPSKLDVMIQIVSRENLPVEALEAQMGEPLEHTYVATIRDGVAMIPIEGPMFKRADWFSRMSGATSYADIATDFHAAIEDPEVRAVILSFDSEGGQVAGCSELARMIFDARGIKPIVAYVEGCCASAAYWLASACDEIVAADTALVGSLGVVIGIEITKKQDEMLGIEHVEIVSSQTPNKRVDPTKAAGRAKLQTLVDELAGVFLASVAEYRAIAPAGVAEQYDAGGLFVGASAVEAGIADRLGSFEGLMAELSGEGSLEVSDDSSSDVLRLSAAIPPATASAPAGRRPTTTPLSETAMKSTTQAGRRGAPRAAAAPAANQPDPANPGDGSDDTTDEPLVEVDDDASTTTTTAQPDAIAAAVAKARADERVRVLAIQALGRPGEEAIVASCVADPACTPATAALKLRQAEPKAASNHLAALAGDESQAPAPSAAAAAAELSELDAAAESIVNAGKPAKTSATR